LTSSSSRPSRSSGSSALSFCDTTDAKSCHSRSPSDRGMAGASNLRGIPLGFSSALSHLRSRPLLRRSIPAPRQIDGHPRPTYRRAQSVAEFVCREIDRIHSPRMSRSSDLLQRGTFAPRAERLCHILQHHSNTPRLAQRCAGRARHTARRRHYARAACRRVTPRIRSNPINGRDRPTQNPSGAGKARLRSVCP